MLVLYRKNYEQIYIFAPDGKQITVKILEVSKGMVRIGIDAPVEYKIERDNHFKKKE